MREFDSGATRDTDEGKLKYTGFLSPLVQRRYAEYMHKHRFQADGVMRPPDNWKKLFGVDHLDVCMDSLYRHVMAMWLVHEGYDGEDIEESICAVMFNLNAYLFKILREQSCNK